MDLGPVDRITAGTIGEPGERTFFLQARAEDRLATVLVEKQQVQLLAASILEAFMADLRPRDGHRAGRGEAGARRACRPHVPRRQAVDRIRPRARAVRVGGRGRFPDEDDEPVAVSADPDVLALAATREQMFALSPHGAAIVDQGRPTCQFCGNPIDAEGHACPAMNGHPKRD